VQLARMLDVTHVRRCQRDIQLALTLIGSLNLPQTIFRPRKMLE
jgi:hypothetical protein